MKKIFEEPELTIILFSENIITESGNGEYSTKGIYGDGWNDFSK